MSFRPYFQEVSCSEQTATAETPVLSGRCWFDTLRTARQSWATSDGVLFLHQLFVRFGVTDHFLFKHLFHGFFYLLEKDLRNPATQGVDCVQELGLDGVEERLEHVVLKGKLQTQRHYCASALVPKLSQTEQYLQIRQQGRVRVGWVLH